MKKTFTLMLIAFMLLSVLAGCATVDNPINSETPSEPPEEIEQPGRYMLSDHIDYNLLSKRNRVDAEVVSEEIEVVYAYAGETVKTGDIETSFYIYKTGYHHGQGYQPLFIAETYRTDEFSKSFIIDLDEDMFADASARIYLASVSNFGQRNYTTHFVVVEYLGLQETYVITPDASTKPLRFEGVPVEFDKDSVTFRYNGNIVGDKHIYAKYNATQLDNYFTNGFVPSDTICKVMPSSDVFDGYPESGFNELYPPYHNVLQNFEAQIKNANGKYVKGTIEKGEKLKITATDRISKVYFETESGKTGYFIYSYDVENKLYLVSGVDEAEIFDGIANAG